MMPSEARIHARKTSEVGMTMCGMIIVFTPFEEDINSVYVDRVLSPPRLDEVTCLNCKKKGNLDGHR